jgi:Transposase
MGKARRKYTDAYKAEVVELVINSGRPVAEIARELGIILSFPVDHGCDVGGRVVDGVADAAA